MCSPNSISPIVLNNVFLALIQYLIKLNMVDLIVIFLLIYKILSIFSFWVFWFPMTDFSRVQANYLSECLTHRLIIFLWLDSVKHFW